MLLGLAVVYESAGSIYYSIEGGVWIYDPVSALFLAGFVETCLGFSLGGFGFYESV